MKYIIIKLKLLVRFDCSFKDNNAIGCSMEDTRSVCFIANGTRNSVGVENFQFSSFIVRVVFHSEMLNSNTKKSNLPTY